MADRLLEGIDIEWTLPNGSPPDLLARCLLHSQAACTQSVFILHLLQEVHERSCNHSNLRDVEEDTDHGLKIGVVGCGRLGTLILRALIKSGCTASDRVMVSTRRPHTVDEFASKGVQTCFDNHKVCASCNVLLLCCPPSQLPSVAKDVRDCVPPSTIVLSYLAGVAVTRVQNLLSCGHTIHVPFWTAPSEGESEELRRLSLTHLLPVLSPVQSTKIKETCSWFGCLMRILVAHCQQECGHLEEALRQSLNELLHIAAAAVKIDTFLLPS